jgi:protein-S-isoprenylcysteine O-methyltransferase Ste14
LQVDFEIRGLNMWAWMFKYRGLLFIPLALLVIIFGKPTPGSFYFGLVIACSGELLRCWSVGYSGITTRDNKIIAPFLVTAGPYAYIRNPLYLGNIITALGFVVMACGGFKLGLGLIFIVGVFLFYYLVYDKIIKLEEEYLIKTFAEDYKTYLQTVPRLLPYKSALSRRQGKFKPEVIWKAEIHTIGLLVLVLAIFAWKTFFS